ncbi:MAG: hypothetical protein RMJ00_00945 [Nitrososphaerota archaeon]|nr:hypothetical protein [Candidatus Bathyarchaeota archaeon]MCX8161480.1 hypothetical protein [Candidatus Bathyarchaeota archaeon]MDW8061253.1 hypothetical protein [Nitrososphaerota archaeon]
MVSRTLRVSIVAVSSPLWALLNAYVGPLGFQLFNLPILCDLSSYLPLIVASGLARIPGTAISVSLVGSLILLLLRPGAFHIFGFVASSILFEVLAFTVRYRFTGRFLNITVACIATIASAYLAGVLIGIVFMGRSLEWALGYWGPLHASGGILALVVGLPTLKILEKALRIET